MESPLWAWWLVLISDLSQDLEVPSNRIVDDYADDLRDAAGTGVGGLPADLVLVAAFFGHGFKTPRIRVQRVGGRRAGPPG